MCAPVGDQERAYSDSGWRSLTRKQWSRNYNEKTCQGKHATSEKSAKTKGTGKSKAGWRPKTTKKCIPTSWGDQVAIYNKMDRKK